MSRRSPFTFTFTLAAATTTTAFLSLGGCGGVRLADLEAPRPLPPDSCLVLGFMGGRDDWNDETMGVRKLAVALRTQTAGVFAETFENRHREVAEDFVVRALDRNRDGRVDGRERRPHRLVVYGQSFGGAAVVKFSRELQERSIDLDLTVQIDSVGRGDGEIPGNVRFALNLYQASGWFIKGEHPIRAVDPSKTVILGNWEFVYNEPPGSEIDISDLPWWKTAFRSSHTRMDRDPEVWRRTESIVRAACGGEDLLEVAGRLARDGASSGR